MARSLPLYYSTDKIEHTVSGTAETSRAAMTYNGSPSVPGGVLVRGVVLLSSATGNKHTIRVYNGDSTDLRYEVELDNSSAATKSDLMEAGIPLFDAPYWTVQADGGSADLKIRFYVQALSKVG